MDRHSRNVPGLGRTLAVVAALLIAATTAAGPPDWKVPQRAARKKNPLTPDSECIAVGKDLYAGQCAACHGVSGHGDGTAAKDLDPKPHDLTAPSIAAQTDGALFWKIGEGHRPMPGFKLLISEDGRWHVVCFLRTLAPPPSTQPSTQRSIEPATQPSTQP